MKKQIKFEDFRSKLKIGSVKLAFTNKRGKPIKVKSLKMTHPFKHLIASNVKDIDISLPCHVFFDFAITNMSKEKVILKLAPLETDINLKLKI